MKANFKPKQGLEQVQ